MRKWIDTYDIKRRKLFFWEKYPSKNNLTKWRDKRRDKLNVLNTSSIQLHTSTILRHWNIHEHKNFEFIHRNTQEKYSHKFKINKRKAKRKEIIKIRSRTIGRHPTRNFPEEILKTDSSSVYPSSYPLKGILQLSTKNVSRLKRCVYTHTPWLIDPPLSVKKTKCRCYSTREEFPLKLPLKRDRLSEAHRPSCGRIDSSFTGPRRKRRREVSRGWTLSRPGLSNLSSAMG